MYGKTKKEDCFIVNIDKLPRNLAERDRQIVSFVYSCLESFRIGRQDLENIWLESWASYIGSQEAIEFQRTLTAEIVGDVNNDWRHKVNVGKAYEIVETVVAYLSAAIFPNRDWVKIEPLEPILTGMARVLSKYFSVMLEDWKFKSHFISSLRQCAITGSTVFSCTWKDDKVVFETLDNFSVYYDPTSTNAEDSPVIRQVLLTRAEIIKKIESGEFTNITAEEVCSIEAYQYGVDEVQDNIDIVRGFHGLDTNESLQYSDKVECWEFWGDVILDGVVFYNHYAIIIGEKLVKFDTSSYDCGKPFVAGSYTPIVRQPHGISSYQPVLGMLHVLNCATNQRLDNVEIATNVMFKRKQSSITPAEDCFVEPAKVFDVLEMDEIEMFAPSANNLLVTYQETATITNSIEQTTGTGPLVSTGQPRGGERVTAKEVSMVREAGSNRLSVVHNHLEENFLIPILDKILSIMVQYVNKSSIIRISGLAKDSNQYFEVGRRELKDTKLRLRPRGAGHIIEQREYIEKRTQFVQLVLSVPEFAKRINYEKILIDLLENWGFEDPMSYLVEAPTEQPNPQLGTPPLEKMGGKGLENAAMQELALDGGNSALQKIAGIELPEGVNLNDLISGLTSVNGGSGLDIGASQPIE